MPSVQYVRWAKFRVVVTATVALLILATLVVLLTGGSLFEQQAQIYTYLPDATGLSQGSPVRVDGIQVGKIDSIAISASGEPTRVVRVTMRVERGLLNSITVDSTAQAAADTLVGDQYVQITTGKRPERVQPGAEIPYKGSGDLMTSLDLSQFRKSIDQMDTILTDIENARNPVGEFVMTDIMYRQLLKRVGELESGLHAATSTTSALGRELYTDTLYRQVSQPIARIDDTLARLQSGQGSAGQFLRDNAQYDQLHAQIVSLRKSIADVRGSAFLTSSESYDRWGRNLSGLIRKVDEFTVSPLLLRTDVYEGFSGAAREIEQSMRDFREDPRKFLRTKVF
jgi:phospholipid/cholesterol/gamma-HCH transport system substrate-binding protein